MGKFRLPKTNFTLGKVSEAALSRTDIQAYAGMAKQFLNVFPTKTGGFYRRPGTGFLTDEAYSTRMVRVDYSDLGGYILLITNAGAIPTIYSFGGMAATWPPADTWPLTDVTTTEWENMTYFTTGNRVYLMFPTRKPIIMVLNPGAQMGIRYIDWEPKTGIVLGSPSFSIAPSPDPTGTMPFTAQAAGVNMVLSHDGSTYILESSILSEASHAGAHWKTVVGSTCFECIISSRPTDWITPTKVRVIRTNNTLSPMPALPHTFTTYAFSEWSPALGFPTKAFSYAGRIGFYGVANLPDSIYFSYTYNIDLLADPYILDPRVNPTGAESFTLTLVQNAYNAIVYVSAGQFLHVGTTADEWTLYATDSGWGRNTAAATRRTRNGSNGVATRFDSELLAVGVDGLTIKSYVYSNEEQTFVASTISDFFSPSFNEGWAYTQIAQDSTNGAFFLRTSEGEVHAVFRDRQTGKNVFCNIELGGRSDQLSSKGLKEGRVMDMAILRQPQSNSSFLVLQVFRKQYDTVSATWKNRSSIEVLPFDSSFILQGPYVDCSHTVEIDWDATEPESFPATDMTTWYPFSPIYNRTALGVYNGFPLDVSISSVGIATVAKPKPEITLAVGSGLKYSYSVGFGYDSIVELPDVEAGSQVGSSIMAIKKIHKAMIRFFNTPSVEIGQDESSLQRIELREPSLELGTQTEPFTGMKTIVMNGDYDNEKVMVIKQSLPAPLGIHSISLEGVTFD